ncbi:MAG TPA: ABC transporter permease, partial [Burkholderiales bacterium]
VAHQERLVAVLATKPTGQKAASDSDLAALSWPDWIDFQRRSTLFDAFIADPIMGTTLSIGDRAERMAGMVVSSNYFDALGVRPILGRGFEPAEDSGRNAHPVAVISYWLWQQRFHGDPQIIGKTQLLNGVPHTIIGVAPEKFYGTFVGYPMEFWVPASMQETFIPGGYKLEDRSAGWVEGFARLKPGVTIDQAQAELSTVARQLEREYPDTNRGRGIKLFPLYKTPFNQAGNLFPTLRIALAVTMFVLLIACANVSNLLLVRSFARQHEMTVRLAVGARRGRLLKQLVTEGLILSALGAAGGFLLAYLCRNLLAAFFPLSGTVAVNLSGEIDWRVLAFSAGVCLISTVIFALFPALQASKVDLAGALKSDSGPVFGGGQRARFRSSLVLLQVALCFILVVAAVLLIQTQRRIRRADPGFATENVLVTGFDLKSAGYDTQRAKNFYDRVIERVQTLGGVDSAALARISPFSYATYLSAPITVEGYQPAANERPTAEFNQISPGYFTTMGIPLVSGREFTRADDENAPLVAIVNEKMVAQYWHGEDPVGKRLQVRLQDGAKWMQVIGVAKLAKYSSFAEAPQAFFYVPLRQNFSLRANLFIRTSQTPAAIAAELTREIHTVDANLAPSEVITLRRAINRTSLSSQQIAVALLTIFGGLALLLATIGLYALMSYAVSQSTRELGLRMALGAQPADVLRLVISRGLLLTGTGILLGGFVALMITRWMA